MRKIKIKTPKELKLPKGQKYLLVDPLTYSLYRLAEEERATRQKFWENVWQGLSLYGKDTD